MHENYIANQNPSNNDGSFTSHLLIGAAFVLILTVMICLTVVSVAEIDRDSKLIELRKAEIKIQEVQLKGK